MGNAISQVITVLRILKVSEVVCPLLDFIIQAVMKEKIMI